MYIELPKKASCTGNGAKKPGNAKKNGFDCTIFSSIKYHRIGSNKRRVNKNSIEMQ